MKFFKIIFLSATFMTAIVSTQPAFAGDAVTLVFKSGQVVTINNGYQEIVNQMKTKSTQNQLIDLDIGGGTFLLNVSEVVIVCRDDCRSLKIVHQLDPARSKNADK